MLSRRSRVIVSLAAPAAVLAALVPGSAAAAGTHVAAGHAAGAVVHARPEIGPPLGRAKQGTSRGGEYARRNETMGGEMSRCRGCGRTATGVLSPIGRGAGCVTRSGARTVFRLSRA